MNKIKTVLAVLLLVPCFFIFAACEGQQGKSAYQIAVDNGYTGTETEWLESLKGDKGDSSDDGMNDVAARALLSAVSVSATFEGLNGTSLGSGVIIQLDKDAGDAYIITNYHVVYYTPTSTVPWQQTTGSLSNDVKIYLYGQEYSEYAVSASYIGGSLTQDIAVLKVENSDVIKNSAAVAAGVDISQIYAGESVIAAGNPSGGGLSVTKGIVSVDSEEIAVTLADNSATGIIRVMRIDAAINEGNSGGGLFDSDGNLVGIVNAKIEAEGIENMAYAIPSSVAYGIAANIIDQYESGSGEAVSAMKMQLGVATGVTASKAVYDSDSQVTRIVQEITVSEVQAGSSADGVLREGDILVSIVYDGKERALDREYALSDYMYYFRKGDTVTLKVMRDGSAVTVAVTLNGEPTQIE